MSKSCKVIVTYIGARPVRVRHARQRRGIRLQYLPDADSVLILLRDVLDLERHVDPGGDLDTIIVFNGGYPEETRDFFSTLDGTKTPGGKLRVISRDNTGLSFGGYAHAFREFQDEYDFWLFCEDDVLQTKPDYLPAYRKALTGNVGFVATVGVAKYHDEKHAHGGCGYTSREILQQVASQHGGTLPYANKEPTFAIARKSGKTVFDHMVFCREGEVPFTNTMVSLGYSIIMIDDYTEAYYEWKQALRAMIKRTRLI